MSSILPVGVLLLQHAHAWEADQLTGRGEPLDDITDRANAEVDRRLDVAAALASRRLGPHASDRRAHRVVARVVHHELARQVHVRGRGWWRGLGHGAYSAWLETADLPRRDFLDRSDLFSGTRFGWAPVLASVGTCSTVQVAGVRMGTDKPAHFFGTGWSYFRRSGTEDPSRGVRWGTRTERTWYGWLTSSAFSPADLHANWRGWAFYASLVAPDGGLLRVADGEVQRVGAFDWRDWVDPRWDELLYPSTYRPRVRAYLVDLLTRERARYCVDAGDLAEARGQVGPGPEPWIHGRRIPADDPFAALLDCP